MRLAKQHEWNRKTSWNYYPFKYIDYVFATYKFGPRKDIVHGEEFQGTNDIYKDLKPCN